MTANDSDVLNSMAVNIATLTERSENYHTRQDEVLLKLDTTVEKVSEVTARLEDHEKRLSGVEDEAGDSTTRLNKYAAWAAGAFTALFGGDKLVEFLKKGAS